MAKLGPLLARVLAPGRDPQALAAQIRAAVPRARGGEQQLLARLASLVDGLARTPEPSPAAVAAQLLQLLRDWCERTPSEVEVQRKIAAALSALGRGYGREAPGPALHREAIARYRGILRRFPEDIGALYGLGHAVLYGSGDPVAGLRALKRCVALAPDRADCRAVHRRLAARYEAPFCMDLPADLAVHRAWTGRADVPDRVRTRTIRNAGHQLLVEEVPALRARQVARAVQQSGKQGIALELRPDVKEQQLALFRAWSPQVQRAVVVRGDRVLAVSAVPPAYEVDALILAGPLEAICERIVRRRLPEALSLVKR